MRPDAALERAECAAPAEGPESVWAISESPEDPEWDAYLMAHPCGQFQQSTLWSHVKAEDGWSVTRVQLRCGGQLAGGAQILHRKSRLGRIGYVIKGPIVSHNADMSSAMERVRAVARAKRLRALIVQGPDFWGGSPDVFAEGGGQRERFMGVIDATLAIDLAKPLEKLHRERDRVTRQLIRQAAERGITIREGDRHDVATFFELMLETCRRQQVVPNPDRVESLLRLWDVFRRHTDARLTLALANGKVIAGLLGLVFGDRLTLWKKGWRNVDARLKPNYLLYADAIEWGHKRGLKWCDFGSLNRVIAEALAAGKPLPVEHRQGRDIFNLSFGGQPFLLPPPFIHFPNWPLRSAYRMALAVGIPRWLRRRRARSRPHTDR